MNATAEAVQTDIPDFGSVELHLSAHSTGLPSKYGKKIKAAGGNYRHVRGYADYRYVTVPASERDLVNALLTEYPAHKKTTVVVRGVDYDRHLQAWVVVHDIPRDCDDPMTAIETKFADMFRQAVRREIIPPFHKESPCPKQ